MNEELADALELLHPILTCRGIGLSQVRPVDIINYLHRTFPILPTGAWSFSASTFHQLVMDCRGASLRGVAAGRCVGPAAAGILFVVLFVVRACFCLS